MKKETYKADYCDLTEGFCVFICNAKNEYLAIQQSGFNFLSEAQERANELNEESKWST